MTGNRAEEQADDFATAYRDASENAETLAEEWAEASSETWDELDE